MATHTKGHEQFAALPWRFAPQGLQVLLITSRETRRWVIPKGWPMKTKTAAQVAAQEAYEEAGVVGTISETPLGAYSYDKRLSDRTAPAVFVKVFALEVLVEHLSWPEMHQREKRWLTPVEAATFVEEPELKRLISAWADRTQTSRP